MSQPAGGRGTALSPSYPHRWLPLLGIAGALGALFWFNPSSYHFYPLCIFHHVTGWLCPGCGSLRAAHQLLHGHLAAAFRFNAWFMICLPFLVWYGLKSALGTAPRPGSRWFASRWFWVFLAVTVLFGVLRNLSGSPFSFLRP